MNLPNVVIAGAPKCGTTSLFNWLADHPEVCGSSIKETYYLMDKGYSLFRESGNYIYGGVDGYQAFFKDYDKYNQKIILEATPDYLYQKTALNVLADLPTKPDIIFILRKPSERVYSLYQFARNNMVVLDRKISFTEFVDTVVDNKSLSLKEMQILSNAVRDSQYIDFISKWFLRLGKERVHVFLFEDMKKNPLAMLENISEIIGIEKSFYKNYDFATFNKSNNYKSILFHKLINFFQNKVPDGQIRLLLKKIYFSINTRPAENLSQEDNEVLVKLDKHFEPYNQALAEQAQIDLSSWNL